VLWIAAIAARHLVADDMNAATREVLFSCSFVVIIAVIPCGYVRRRYVGNTRERVALTSAPPSSRYD
jgi:hypothetical protein